MAQYLLRQYKPSELPDLRRGPVAHVWDGKDTACRMVSTGGITKMRRFRVAETPEGRPICVMCRAESLDEQMRDAMAREA